MRKGAINTRKADVLHSGDARGSAKDTGLKEKKQKTSLDAHAIFKQRYDANECVFINPQKCVICSPFKKMIPLHESEWKAKFGSAVNAKGQRKYDSDTAQCVLAVSSLSIEIRQPLKVLAVQHRKYLPFQCYQEVVHEPLRQHPFSNLGSEKSIEHFGKSLVLNVEQSFDEKEDKEEKDDKDEKEEEEKEEKQEKERKSIEKIDSFDKENLGQELEGQAEGQPLLKELEHPHGTKVYELLGVCSEDTRKLDTKQSGPKRKESKELKHDEKPTNKTKWPSQAQDTVVWIQDQSKLILPMSVATLDYCLQAHKINDKNELDNGPAGWRLINIIDRTMVIPAEWYPQHLKSALEKGCVS